MGPDELAEDPERIAIREALAFGKAVYDVRIPLGITVAEVALRAGLTEDEVECIDEGGTESTAPCFIVWRRRSTLKSA